MILLLCVLGCIFIEVLEVLDIGVIDVLGCMMVMWFVCGFCLGVFGSGCVCVFG